MIYSLNLNTRFQLKETTNDISEILDGIKSQDEKLKALERIY